MRLTQYSFLPVPPTAPQIILSLFFSPFSNGFYFCTVSTNVHHIVVPFCGSCFKRACHQLIWTEVQNGEELPFQDCHLCVLFPEQTSLNLLSMPRREGLAGEVQLGLSSAFMSHSHHREYKCSLCAGELDFPAQVTLHTMTGSWILNAATVQHQQHLQPLVSCWASPSHRTACREV